MVMKVGDLVLWIGFDGVAYDDQAYGVIISVIKIDAWNEKTRYNVLWCGGTIGHNLYPDTIKKIL